MDTIFKIVKPKATLLLGADHFGTDLNMIRATRIILDILNHHDVMVEDYLFVKHHLYLIPDGEYQDIEVLIDTAKQEILLDTNILLTEIKDDPSYVHVDFDQVDLLHRRKLNYQEFDIFQNFFFLIKEYDEVLINNKYLYQVSK